MKNGKKIGLLLTGFALAFAMLFCIKSNSLAYNSGDKFWYEDVRYQVVKTGSSPTCKVVDVKDGKSKIMIYGTPKYDGEDLTCTSIDASAFRGNEDITYVKISVGASKITNIPANCFRDCTNLKKVVIASTAVKTINKNAFRGCESLTTIAIANKSLTKSAFKANAFKGVESVKVISQTSKAAKKYATYIKSRGATETTYKKASASTITGM